MIHNIQTTDLTIFKNSIRDTLLSKDLISNIHYDSGINIVFSLVGFTGVYKISGGNWYYGDAWTGTVNITNQILIQNYYSTLVSGMDCVLITFTGGFAVSINNGIQSGILTIIFTSKSNGGKIALAFGASNSISYNNSWCYDLTTKDEIFFAIRGSGLVCDSSGFIYSTELSLKNNAGLLTSLTVTGVKFLLKAAETTTHTVYGNDLSIPANFTSDGGTPLNGSLLLIGGNV